MLLCVLITVKGWIFGYAIHNKTNYLQKGVLTMAITTINQENFDDQVTRSSAPVLLDFWAAWCGPCSMLSPVVEELAEELF